MTHKTLPPPPKLSRRESLALGAATAVASAATAFTPSAIAAQRDLTMSTAIRPFHVNFPEPDLADLRRRVAATRWPDKEQVADASQGVKLATIQKLAQYWTDQPDWRKCEAKINAVPNFITEIDGLDIHFIHVRSKHENALPMIVSHGWPGSIIEQMKIIEPLTILGRPAIAASGNIIRDRHSGRHYIGDHRCRFVAPAAAHCATALTPIVAWCALRRLDAD
jgi:Epoxide hydrolase N terminus